MRSLIFAVVLSCSAAFASAGDGLRVATWNITYYNGSNSVDIQNTLYGMFGGESLSPDVILVQEITNQNALNLLVAHLNSAAGSPGDWAQGIFYSASTSGGINTALVYRTSKLDLLGSVVVKPGTSGQNPRNVVRYDVRLDGYSSESATLSLYPVHMKAGSGSSDQARRLIESQAITTNAATLPADRNYIVAGDFNIQSSNQSAYVQLVGSPYNTGVFRDPIRTPGTWNNNGAFRYVHTQDPETQMDDRYDILLTSPSFGDGVGLEYIGDFDTTFSTSTWNDPDHSYRCYGNDGSTYNAPMNTASNANCGNSIAQSIKNLSGNTGHAPVYFDTTVPAVITSDTITIEFGVVEIGDTATTSINVGSGGDVALWGTLIEGSTYSFVSGGPELNWPAGSFNDDAGGGLNNHSLTFTPDAEGLVTGTLLISSNDSQTPILSIPYSANVIDSGCPADMNGDGIIDNGDIGGFLDAFLGGNLAADFNDDGILDNGDIGAFLTAFLAGC